MGEGNHRASPQILGCADLSDLLTGNQNQLLTKDCHRLKFRCGERLGHKSGFNLEIHDPIDKSARSPGDEFHDHTRVLGVIARKNGRQAASCRALQRAEAKHSLRLPSAQLIDRFVRQPEEPHRIVEKGLAFSRKSKRTPFPAKQAYAQVFLQLPDTGRHV